MDQGLRLLGARVALDATRAEPLDISIHNRRVRYGSRDGRVIDLGGYLILPGLINAHDHLEFNLFPRLGQGPYANAAEWAADIYRPHEPPLEPLLRIAKPVRVFWGAVKNLVSGVTTVSNHNACEATSLEKDFPVRVVRRFGWAHSLDFSPDIVDRFRAAPRNWPFIVHAAEGVDARSRCEIARLDEIGVLTRRSVLVHAVAAGADDISLVQKRNASVVWCPSSNLFLFGRTLVPDLLNADVPTALGTDSSLTGQGDLLDELRIARNGTNVESERLYRMVTTEAARVLRLRNGEGSIRERGIADLVVVADRGRTPAAALLDLQPELVMIGGSIRLVSTSLAARCGVTCSGQWQRIAVEGRGEWLTPIDMRPALEATLPILDGEFRLARRKVRFEPIH